MPVSVLSGGQYDRLMRKMGRASGAVGFAVYLDELGSIAPEDREPDADVLLLYGPDASPEAVCRQVQLFTARGLRVLAQQKRPEHGLFGRVVELGKGEPGC